MFDNILSPLKNIFGFEDRKEAMASLTENTVLSATKQSKLSAVKALE